MSVKFEVNFESSFEHLKAITFLINAKKYVLPFLGGITTETNFDLILSFNDACFQIIILFLVLVQYISSSLKNRFTENYLDLQVDSQQELRIRICCTLSINIVNAYSDHHYSTVVLQTKV